jgi:hypothetical protein
MAGCDSFDVTVTSDLAGALDRVKSQITGSGGSFTGDTQGGSFSGEVPMMGGFEGRYEVSGDVVTITIIDKPFLIPCAIIESKIREFFG